MLQKAAVMYKDQPEKLQELQAKQTLGPNLQTFNISIDHHIVEMGSLTAITALLEEMRVMGVAIHGKIFVKLFRGFSQHGGVSYTTWTRARLQSVWIALVELMDQEERNVKCRHTDVEVLVNKQQEDGSGRSPSPSNVARFDDTSNDDEDGDKVSESPSAAQLRQGRNVWLSKWLVIWCVRAFAGLSRMREIWDELRQRWEPEDYKEEEAVYGVVRDLEKRLERGIGLKRDR